MRRQQTERSGSSSADTRAKGSCFDALSSWSGIKGTHLLQAGILLMVLAALTTFLNALLDEFFPPSAVYALSLLIVAFVMSLLCFLFLKPGGVIIYLLLVAAFSYTTHEFGIIGVSKLMILFVVGVVFELSHLMACRILTHKCASVLISSALATATIPLMTIVMLSTGEGQLLVSAVVNILILGLIAGMCGTLLACALYSVIGNSKILLRFKFRR